MPNTLNATADARDQEEHVAVTNALSVLPSGHPARLAYAAGAATIALTHLVADQPDILEALKAAYLDGFGRTLQRGSSFQPYRRP